MVQTRSSTGPVWCRRQGRRRREASKTVCDEESIIPHTCPNLYCRTPKFRIDNLADLNGIWFKFSKVLILTFPLCPELRRTGGKQWQASDSVTPPEVLYCGTPLILTPVAQKKCEVSLIQGLNCTRELFLGK